MIRGVLARTGSDWRKSASRASGFEEVKTLLITSPLPGDGKSTVALNLATVFVPERESMPVLLLEADVYRPSLVKNWVSSRGRG